MIQFKQILDFHDEIILFSAVDFIGNNYIFVIHSEDSVGDNIYVGMQVASEDFGLFISGEVDLRLLFEKYNNNTLFYVVQLLDNETRVLKIKDFLEEEDLPLQGYYIKMNPDGINIINKSIEKNIPYFSIALKSATNSHFVRSDTAGEVLLALDSLYKHTQKKWTKANLSDVDTKRKFPDEAQCLLLETTEHSSFEFVFRVPSEGEMFKFYSSDPIKYLLGFFNSAILDSDLLVKIRFIGGHGAAALRNLFKALSENQLSAVVSYFDPAAKIYEFENASNAFANRVVDLINSTQEVLGEDVSFEGFFKKLDEPNNSWVFISNDGNKKIAGSAVAGVSLDGLTLITVRYRINCLVIHEKRNSRKMVTKYKMSSVNEIKKDE